jgi:hypothetical protein
VSSSVEKHAAEQRVVQHEPQIVLDSCVSGRGADDGQALVDVLLNEFKRIPYCEIELTRSELYLFVFLLDPWIEIESAQNAR